MYNCTRGVQKMDWHDQNILVYGLKVAWFIDQNSKKSTFVHTDWYIANWCNDCLQHLGQKIYKINRALLWSYVNTKIKSLIRAPIH